jgi:flagellar biosynthesis/type III secretory pathway M-ring protein FliF/YscJ
MEQVQRMLATIREQLVKLSATQRLLIASLLVILLMTMFLVSQYAGAKEYVPLLPASATPEQVQQVSQYLSEANIEHRVREGLPEVPPQRRRAIIAQMGQAGALPGDTSMLFADLIDAQSWTMSNAQQAQLYNIALQNELAGVIAQMRGITGATVIIDAPERRGLGAAVRTPTASVTVTHQERELSQDSVDAIASLVAGAKAGLSIANVVVVDGVSNRQRRARTEDSLASGTHLELKVKYEKLYRNLLTDFFGYIDGVMIAVTAQVDATRQTSSVTAVLPPGQGTVTTPSVERQREFEQSSGSVGAEPGVRSNAGLDIARGGSGGGGTTESETEAELETRFGTRSETIHDPRGRATKLNAAINVPRSYVLREWRFVNGEDAEAPDAAALEAFFQQEQGDIEAKALTLLEAQGEDGATTPGAVVVSMIPDPTPMAPAQAGGGFGMGLGAGGGGGILASGWLKTALLGALAVGALGLMALALKKAGRRPDLPTAEELVGIPPALENVDIMGEAGEAESALAGIELSDEDMQKRQMLDQVAAFVKDSPEEAAGLFQRWMSTEAGT